MQSARDMLLLELGYEPEKLAKVTDRIDGQRGFIRSRVLHGPRDDYPMSSYDAIALLPGTGVSQVPVDYNGGNWDVAGDAQNRIFDHGVLLQRENGWGILQSGGFRSSQVMIGPRHKKDSIKIQKNEDSLEIYLRRFDTAKECLREDGVLISVDSNEFYSAPSLLDPSPTAVNTRLAHLIDDELGLEHGLYEQSKREGMPTGMYRLQDVSDEFSCTLLFDERMIASPRLEFDFNNPVETEQVRDSLDEVLRPDLIDGRNAQKQEYGKTFRYAMHVPGFGYQVVKSIKNLNGQE